MTPDLQRLRFIERADVYKNGVHAGELSRTTTGGIRFDYLASYLAEGQTPVAFSLPLDNAAVQRPNGALPAFFAGLLPEGHRLTVLKNATKTSFDDELTLLMAVGADVPGDVQIVPAGQIPAEPKALADTSTPEDLDFAVLANSVDLHALPGVQDKASASMLTTPLATRGQHYLLKLDPAQNPHLVANEAAHLGGAGKLNLPVVRHRIIHDKHGLAGLLVERFDRRPEANGHWQRMALEDGTQVMGLPPAAKYTVAAEDVAVALARLCLAPVVASRNLYLQFAFAWLTGNGDLHAKNLSVLGRPGGGFEISPMYDVPCTLLYGDDTMALPIAGKIKNLKARHWAEFADALGLPPRAAASANRLALKAASSVDLTALPFEGSMVRGAQRELRFRRHEMQG
ncbi:type II toxin-antitoxin system HipA family toxin [Paeniglutamicibacter terrestris]|uniref:Type II toxin-antitoxin system HipA family toxin n=1 Tax=Paeniglutamicibacter terrestris TaxID=2723403 RepID=A0ABX1G568_9MICC|nr:HipA domain-containing protein [Paeniglutamicibacter terrestris]NKG20805.1 type II toxin-antitoxin system HipA family toxin [Paeniglutamicibacter terrestris]